MSDLFLDLERAERTSMPEVVFGQNKTATQCETALRGLIDKGGRSLATRVDADKGAYLSDAIDGQYDEVAQTYQCGDAQPANGFQIAVVCAGTSDLPVAKECINTLQFMGYEVQPFNDVGVAGLHRLLSKLDKIRKADFVIVIAGMEGALPSVLGGLIANPIVAVPTSVGYGASFNGLSSLLGMLNSCAPGMSVVNIDNGFGAAVTAHRTLSFKKK